MKKLLIFGALALLTTISFAAEEKSLTVEESDDFIKSISTIFKMELPKSDFDKNILVGLSGLKNMASIYSDLYASRKCTTKYDGISEWIYQFQQKASRDDNRLVSILVNLNTKYASDKAAQTAYKTLIVSEYVKSCGTEDEIVDFIKMTK